MSNKKQSSVDQLINQVENSMGLIPVDVINQVKSTHESESIDFALYAMMAESFNDLPEATKKQLREAIEIKYKEYYHL